MRKLLVFGLIFLILLILLIGFYYYRNYSSTKDLKKVDTVDRSDLLTGLATQSNTFNETSGIDEHKKMTYGPVLKNTIMSLEPLRKPSDFTMFGQNVGPTGKEIIPIQIIRPEANGAIGFYTQDGKYIKGVLYNLNTGEKLGTRYYEGTNINTATWTQGAMDSYNINTTIGGGMPVAIAELKNFYPNYIREGLFFIKVGNGLVSNAFYRGNVLPEYGTKKVNNNTETNNVIASERERFNNTHSAITDSPGDKNNPQLIPFMLSLVSKDPVNNRFVFEIRDFRGKVYQFNQYNRCDLFTGPRNKEARLCYHWSYDNDCVVVTPGNSPGIANDEISQVETTYGAKVTLYEDKNYGGGQTSIDENTRRSFGNDWWNDETTSYKVDYSNYLFMGPTSSSNVTSQIIVEFENGKMYIKNSGGYFYNYDRGNEPGGRLRFGDAGLKQECELIPVLDPTLAESYFKASLNYLNRKDVNRQNILNSVDEKDSIAEPFCGTNIDFKDGIRKLDVGTPDSLSSNRITKAFERICACNMDLDPQGYYQQKFCSDNWIKDNYGIDDKTRYQAIRDNLKCTKPNCSFQKCILVFSEPKELSVRNTDSVNDECGGSTMCIINQKFENNGTLIGGTVKMTGTQTCGAVNDKGNGIMSQSGSELEWINITGSQQGNVSGSQQGNSSGSQQGNVSGSQQGNVSGGNVNIQPSSQTPNETPEQYRARREREQQEREQKEKEQQEKQQKTVSDSITSVPQGISKITGFSGNFDDFSSEKNQTAEMCRQKAINSNGKYVAWGHRNENHPDPNYRNTCFLYKSPPFLKPNPPYTFTNDQVHLTGCLKDGDAAIYGCKSGEGIGNKLKDLEVELFEQPNYVTSLGKYKFGMLPPQAYGNKTIRSIKVPVGKKVNLVTNESANPETQNLIKGNVPSININNIKFILIKDEPYDLF